MTERHFRGPDGIVLRSIKAPVRWWFSFFTLLQRRTGFSRWKLVGDCNQCGVCCDTPSIMVDEITWKVLAIRRAFLWWQRTVNGFELIGSEQPGVLNFRCQYWNTTTRQCTSYATRPGMCRDYPQVLLHQSDPEFYKECSYRAVAVNAPRLLRVLNRAELTAAKREELKKRLRLE
jgi:hypothetical protein